MPTATFRLLYVLVVVRHGRREAVRCTVTDHPTAEWVSQQLREAFPFEIAPRMLIHDRDATFGGVVASSLRAMNVTPIRTSYRSPWQNGVAERLIGTIRRELLDHVTHGSGPCPISSHEPIPTDPLPSIGLALSTKERTDRELARHRGLDQQAAAGFPSQMRGCANATGAPVNAPLSVVVVMLVLAIPSAASSEDRVSQAAQESAFDQSKLYPYLVPPGYPDTLSTPGHPRRLLGHGIAVALVLDHDGVVEGVSTERLKRAQLSLDAAYALAARNLDNLLRSHTIKLQAFERGPEGQPFVLVGGHWEAAAAILEPKLRALVAGALKTNELCASVPHRDALLMFPKGTRRSRDAMRALVREKESGAPKPLTFELFELTAKGPSPFDEDEEPRQ